MPTLDFDIIRRLLSKERANKEAHKILDGWRVSKRPREMVSDLMVKGLFVGQLCDSMAVQKQILLVHFNDGKVEKDGIISYCRVHLCTKI